MARGALLYILVTYVLLDAFSATRVEDFWPDVKENLTTLTWAHAVNNATFLATSLQDASVMMLEADVQIGTLPGGTETLPIMAHPPDTVSDLSLAIFLQNVSSHNQNSTSKKGVKLDFKTIEAFTQSQTVISTNYNGSYPIWLNADILSGPGNSTSAPVNSTEFFSGVRSLNLANATLSLGWTTSLNTTTANTTAPSYTDTQIDEMLSVLTAQNVNNTITFAVRAAIAAESSAQVTRLLNGTAGSTITVWSSEGDNVNVTKLREVIGTVGVNRTFLDVPPSLASQLNLGNLTQPMGDNNNGTTNGGNNTTTNGTSTTGGGSGVLATGFLVFGALILGASW